jgi:glycosyltransferase involved in cell wall biosynthesis
VNKLYLIIPAYNEEVNIRAIAHEWHEVVAKTGPDSRLVIIDDGSRDGTFRELELLKEKLPQLVAIRKPNSGHGATVLYGYKHALENGADYVFQTDSDGQTLPSEFWAFWEQRKDFSMIIGHRNNREDGFSRVVVTKVLKLTLWCFLGVLVTDANTPFRLLESEVLRKYISRIPKDFNLSNVLLAAMLVGNKENVLFLPITFRARQGGVNSVNFKKIVKIGGRAVLDFVRLRKALKIRKHDTRSVSPQNHASRDKNSTPKKHEKTNSKTS